ncbi:hypothetical protein ABK040_007804 [Willaertia magna]
MSNPTSPSIQPGSIDEIKDLEEILITYKSNILEKTITPSTLNLYTIDQSDLNNSKDLWIKLKPNIYPLIVLFLAVLFPGLGHIYIGQKEKGIAYMLTVPIYLILSLLLVPFLVGIYFMAMVLLWTAAICADAFIMSKRLRTNDIHRGECAIEIVLYGICCLIPNNINLHLFYRRPDRCLPSLDALI